MKTEIIKLNPDNIYTEKIDYAANVLKSGGLVAFPTETVYGLGADATNENAVKKIFTAKGRPSDNPLIVHISNKNDVERLVSRIPSSAFRLMDKFWPGPLTLIMEKSRIIPHVITAGLSTVAIRMPSHPVALALIERSGLPVAAPSANTSGKPSPTNAKHVIDDLYGKVDVIIDAGSCGVGLESTVLDITTEPPVILRPGGVTYEQLKEVLGSVDTDPALFSKDFMNATPKSPGMKYKHYSPKAEVIIIKGKSEKVAGRINKMAEELRLNGLKVGILATEQTKALYRDAEIISAGDREHLETIASNLFKALREFDKRGVDVILAESVENSGIGLAIMNRLNKAAGYNIIEV
ncbi:MAG TPA: threonylcarbamoyl-AMP synthase [Clostridiaceae bacterium]|nr:threonylcarbamoyl-AMP synthase [Clostridiaceae bacterium]